MCITVPHEHQGPNLEQEGDEPAGYTSTLPVNNAHRHLRGPPSLCLVDDNAIAIQRWQPENPEFAIVPGSTIAMSPSMLPSFIHPGESSGEGVPEAAGTGIDEATRSKGATYLGSRTNGEYWRCA